MRTCYIVDDEFHSVEILSDFVNRTSGLQLIGSNVDAIAAVQEINDYNPDLVFIDIEMPDISGLEFKNLISKSILIIFITAHSQYALNAFNLGASDFLLKPIRYERFLIAIQNINMRLLNVENSNKKNEYFYIQTGVKGQFLKLYSYNVFYIESQNNHIVIHSEEGEHIVNVPLKEFINNLSTDKFTRINKSYIINDERIKMVEGNLVILKSGIKLPIGRAYRNNIYKKIYGFLLKKPD